jgi:hypothetical protein
MFNLSTSTRLVAATGFIICALLFASAYPVAAQSSDRLGTAESFAVLGGQTVTNTGPTTVEGDLGVSPGTSVTGFVPSGPGIVTNGTIHAADEVASQAQSDTTNAYNVLAGEACDDNMTDEDLGGLILFSPGQFQ